MTFFRNLRSLFEPLSEQKAEERYLSQATSLVDLEMRQRRWDQRNRSAHRTHLQ